MSLEEDIAKAIFQDSNLEKLKSLDNGPTITASPYFIKNKALPIIKVRLAEALTSEFKFIRDLAEKEFKRNET